jgi:Ca2+-binding RTX toxin-like protein
MAKIIAENQGVDETITGTNDGDTIYGDSQLGVGDANHTVIGGKGDDLIYGGSRNENIYGGEGSDTIWGGVMLPIHKQPKKDLLDGGQGDDFIHSGYGDDTLIGGEGHDTFMIGGGHNRQQHDFPGQVHTVIRDFTACEDKLVFNRPGADPTGDRSKDRSTEEIAKALDSPEKIAEFLKEQGVTLEKGGTRDKEGKPLSAADFGDLTASVDERHQLVIKGNCIT